MNQIPSNLRIESRKSLFVQATLHFADGFCSVKVRNISPTGALVEAARLPRTGTPVELRRGPLVAMGTVIWRSSGKVGIEFLGDTDVKRWLPHMAVQTSVEDSFQVFKGAPAPAFTPATKNAAMTTNDIELVAELLDDLAETFAKDAGVSFNYAAKLQALAVASQMLRKLASQARIRAS